MIENCLNGYREIADYVEDHYDPDNSFKKLLEEKPDVDLENEIEKHIVEVNGPDGDEDAPLDHNGEVIEPWEMASAYARYLRN